MLGVFRRKAASSTFVYGKLVYNLKPNPKPCSAVTQQIFRGFAHVRNFCNLPLAGLFLTVSLRSPKIPTYQVTIDVTGLNRLYSTYNPLWDSHSGFRTAEHMYDCRACKGETGFINYYCKKCFGFGYGNEIVDEMLLGIDRETEMTQWAICRLVYFWAVTHSPHGYINVAGNMRRSMTKGVLADKYANWKTKLDIDLKTDKLLNFPRNTRNAYGNNMHGLNQYVDNSAKHDVPPADPMILFRKIKKAYPNYVRDNLRIVVLPEDIFRLHPFRNFPKWVVLPDSAFQGVD